jgi:hypothetical protein
MTERVRARPAGESMWLLALAMAATLGWIVWRLPRPWSALSRASINLAAWAGYHFIDVVVIYLIMYLAFWRNISTSRGALYFVILYAVAMTPGVVLFCVARPS